jgi:hypothetical protein
LAGHRQALVDVLIAVLAIETCNAYALVGIYLYIVKLIPAA